MPTDLMSALHRAISRPEQLSQLLGRRTPSQVAGFCQLVSDRRIGQHCIGISADLADGLTWCVGRNEQRQRRHNFVTWDILDDGGHIRGCHIPRRSSARQDANLPDREYESQCATAEVAIDATRYEVRESRRCKEQVCREKVRARISVAIQAVMRSFYPKTRAFKDHWVAAGWRPGPDHGCAGRRS